MSEVCHDCGAKEGELHEIGCDMERCPFCGGQLISCDCRYKMLGYNYLGFGSGHPTSGLPENVYYDGLDERDEKIWNGMLEAKGRIPYIVYPLMCARCGQQWPDFFKVSDEDWNYYIEPRQQDKIICRKCYDEIKEMIDKIRK